MAEQKKSHKSGRKSGSRSATAYKAQFRRYFNKLKRVKRHVKRHPNELQGVTWLAGANKLLAMDYVRGSEAVRKLHAGGKK